MRVIGVSAAATLAAGIIAAAPAQDQATTTPPVEKVAVKPAPAPKSTAAKTDNRVAKVVFGAQKTPADLVPRAIGFYSKGCLAGAKMLPVDGPAWQAMRLSRNRNWGHPALVAFVEKLARDTNAKDAWPGLLVGDLAQPRGGPMLTGHASHQIGLDADIWLTPMPSRRLTAKEREDMSAVNMVAASKTSIDTSVWTEGHVKLIKRAALYPEVERILVHPAIKKALCEAAGTDRAWLKKVRPFWGHDHHFHVRLSCPASSPNCRPQAPAPSEEGCTAELEDWFKRLTRPPPPADPNRPPPKPQPPLTVAQLPADCKAVLEEQPSLSKVRVPKRQKQ
jgi:penicillin-insensitive murein endopeptidase